MYYHLMLVDILTSTTSHCLYLECKSNVIYHLMWLQTLLMPMFATTITSSLEKRRRPTVKR